MTPLPETPQERRAKRIFRWVNVGQWILILVGGNLLANAGLSAWVLPMIIFVVGLHFLPLAYVWRVPPRGVTGLVLMLIAATYPFMASQGPADPIGCLFAGLVLWAGALWSMHSVR